MSSAQSPLLWIPMRATTDVSYSHSLRSTIAQVYQESPDSYKEEISTLDRCRQDALRGSAGSDATGRDLLYKYFGQLELLELRFPEVRVPFPWKDAFTGKEISQLSLAYEKASVIFNIGATLSSLAAQQNRSSPEGLKRAFHNFRCAAGMFTYINDNFLHAPSTDLSREVVKVLVTLMVAQATEVFVERLTEEKKGAGLRARVSTQAASLYGGIVEETKELVSKGVFDRSWTWLVQTKHKYFVSLAQYQRSLADSAASKHGDALSRLTLAEAAAKEAARFASSFSASLHSVNSMSMLGTSLGPANPSAASMPSDAGPALTELTRSHLALCSEERTAAAKDNDLIYHEAVSTEASLPPIERSSVADPIPIQEVYGAPEVQKVVGQDIFIRLVPLSVHESASLYSEEKAKLVRVEGEKCDVADSELSAALEYMGLPASLDKFRDASGSGSSRIDALAEPPQQVKEWAEEIRRTSPPVDALFREIEELRSTSVRDLDSVALELDSEHRDCEQLRVKYGHLWTQAPSAGLTRGFRSELRNNKEALEQAKASDEQVGALWEGVRSDVGTLGDPSGEALERLFAEALASGGSSANGASLLDLDASADDAEREEAASLKKHIKAIEEGLSRLQSLKKERQGVFRDLKERIQSDDISRLLILNRKSSNIEPALFAAELEKFRPHSGRIAATVHHQSLTLQDVSSHHKALTEGKKAKEVQDRWTRASKKRKDLVARFQRAREGHEEVRVGLGKGLSFYRELAEAIARLRKEVTGFISQRSAERTALVRTADVQQRLEGGGANRADSMSPVSAATPAPAIQTLEQQVRSMDLGASAGHGSLPPIQNRASSSSWQPPTQSPTRAPDNLPSPSPPLPHASTYQSFPVPPPSTQPAYGSKPAYSAPPPKPQQPYSQPPPAPPADPYAGLASFGNSYSSAPPPPAPSASATPSYQSAHSGTPYPSASPYGAPPPPRLPQHRDSYPPPPSAQTYQSHVASPAPAPAHSIYTSAPPAQQPSYPGPSSAGQPYGRGLPPPPPHHPQASHWQPPPGQYQYAQPPPPPQGASGQRYSGSLPPPPPQTQQHQQPSHPSPYGQPAYGYPQSSHPTPPTASTPAAPPHAQYYQQHQQPPPPPPPHGYGYASPPPQPQPPQQYGQQQYPRPY